MNVKVENIEGRNGPVKNQFKIYTDDAVYFQSYSSVIVKRSGREITLDKNKWDYSRTTGKYRNIFLGESKSETEKKIKDGIYKLADLNG